MKKFRTLILIIVIAAIVGSIYYLEKPQQVRTDSGEMVTMGPLEYPNKIEVGSVAPDFILNDYLGETVQLSDYKGQAIFLNFWASWCPFCIAELPLLQSAHEKYQSEGFMVIGVNRQESRDTAQTYSDDLGITFPLLLNSADDVAKAYKLTAMPSSYLIDKNGVIQEIIYGPVTEESLEQSIADLLSIEVIESVEEEKDMSSMDITAEESLQVTDGIKHSVPLEDILGGGPPKDGIPSIDNPKFVSVNESDKLLDDDGLGIAVSFNGIDRFYPFQILVWHEIVNDTVGDQPVLITYCPLCGTGIVFDPIIKGKQTEFGTSGKLWNSNLVMYDRRTDTYWSQVLGEAIVGELTGTKLKLLPHQNTTWENWKENHPDGEVLSSDTGFFRNYKRSPYGDYDTSKRVIFPVDYKDDRYHNKALTWGIELNGEFKVYPREELKEMPSQFTDEFAGENLNLEFDDETLIIKITNESTGEEIVPFFGFWFSWIAVHPDSEVFTAN